MKEAASSVKKNGKRILTAIPRKILTVAAVLFLLVVMTLAMVILSPDRPETGAVPVTLPELSASPAIHITAESDLYKLYVSIPVPVMNYLSGSGMTFVDGDAADVPVRNGIARTVTLDWLSPEGVPVTLISIFPPSATELLQKDEWHFSDISGASLFGENSVRMESNEKIRLHTQTDHGLYAVLFPKEAAGSVSVLTRSLQLFSVSE